MRFAGHFLQRPQMSLSTGKLVIGMAHFGNTECHTARKSSGRFMLATVSSHLFRDPFTQCSGCPGEKHVNPKQKGFSFSIRVTARLGSCSAVGSNTPPERLKSGLRIGAMDTDSPIGKKGTQDRIHRQSFVWTLPCHLGTWTSISGRCSEMENGAVSLRLFHGVPAQLSLFMYG